MKLLDMSYRRWMAGFSLLAGVVALSVIGVAQQQPQLGIAAVNLTAGYQSANLPEVDLEPIHVAAFVGHPAIAHREMVGHDSRTGTKL